MQKTTLSTLSARTAAYLGETFANPWRRLVLLIVAALLGFFISVILISAAGQRGVLDITGAAVFLIFTEFVSRYVYGNRKLRPFFVPTLNSLKIGLAYGAYLHAFVLGS